MYRISLPFPYPQKKLYCSLAVISLRISWAHIRPRDEDRAHAQSQDPTKKPRRWVVERLHSWLNRSRRLLVRWEKGTQTYEAFLHLACALLCFRQCDRAQAILQEKIASKSLAA